MRPHGLNARWRGFVRAVGMLPSGGQWQNEAEDACVTLVVACRHLKFAQYEYMKGQVPNVTLDVKQTGGITLAIAMRFTRPSAQLGEDQALRILFPTPSKCAAILLECLCPLRSSFLISLFLLSIYCSSFAIVS
jgi:hypothetical protein